MTDRRTAIAVVGAALLGACESAVARLRGLTLTPIARVDQVPDGDAFRIKNGEQPLILVNADGRIRTFLAECTHEGCPLGWNPRQHLIRCPCHGSAFDTRGQAVEGPAKLPLTEIETIVERGQVFVAQRPKAAS